MSETPIYLKSLNHYNFRHNKENPRVISLVNYTPENLTSRPCLKVLYESDGQIDHIAYETLQTGSWEIVPVVRQSK